MDEKPTGFPSILSEASMQIAKRIPRHLMLPIATIANFACALSSPL